MWKTAWKELAARSHNLSHANVHLMGMRKLRMVASVRAFDYSYVTAPVNSPGLGEIMEWTTPAFEEICLNCEINSYASAKLQ